MVGWWGKGCGLVEGEGGLEMVLERGSVGRIVGEGELGGWEEGLWFGGMGSGGDGIGEGQLG